MGECPGSGGHVVGVVVARAAVSTMEFALVIV